LKTNPLYDPYQILFKIYSGGALLKQAVADTYIEEINRSRTVKIVYGVIENDIYLSHCIRYYAPKSPKLPVRIILKISLYMLIFMDKQKYMVADNAVELTKKLGKSGVSGFVNAFLRKFDLEKIPMPDGDGLLSVKYSFPLYAVKKIKEDYGSRAESILAAKSSGVTVRFVRGEEAYLSREHITTPFPHVYIFKSFVRDENFFSGDYTFQSVGSVAICSVIDGGKNVIDCCSAPGGKAVLLADKFNSVTACELHSHRVNLITQYKTRMGKENITEIQADSTVFNPDFFEKFDAVLCDVPCSGYGTVSENPDIKINRKEEDFSSLAVTQYKILKNCSKYVKRGGRLYYSTCSIFSCENDEIAKKFLSDNPEFAVGEIDSPLPHERTACGVQFLPDKAFGAGFYIAEFKRI